MLLTSSIEALPRRILVAVILSSVSRVLMALSHLDLISSVTCDRSFMTRSHLSTHIRCADSDIRIWSSLSIPFLSPLLHWASWSSSSAVCSSLGVVKVPLPRIRPMLMLGQSSGAWGQVSRARDHMMLTGSAVQEVRI